MKDDRLHRQAQNLLRYAQEAFYERPYRANFKQPSFPIKGDTRSARKERIHHIAIFTMSSNLAPVLLTTINNVPQALRDIQKLVGKDVFQWRRTGSSEIIGPLKNRPFFLQIQNKKMESFFEALQEKMSLVPQCTINRRGVGILRILNRELPIGKTSTRKFKLLVCLCDPFGVAKNVDTVFDAIRLQRDRLGSELSDSYLAADRKYQIIENTFGEIQKIMREHGLPDAMRLQRPSRNTLQLILL